MLRVKPLIYEHNHQEAEKVINLVNDILHKKRDKVVVDGHEAYNSIKSTFAIIEELFK
jgi:cobalamin biosynthesis Co2+ chelatase CbiK